MTKKPKAKPKAKPKGPEFPDDELAGREPLADPDDAQLEDGGEDPDLPSDEDEEDTDEEPAAAPIVYPDDTRAEERARRHPPR